MATPATPVGLRDRTRLGLITVAGAVALVGTFGPWLRSGASRRSSYDLLSLVERIGFAPGGLMEWAVRFWPVVPVLVVAAVVSSWWRWLAPWVPASLGLAAGAYSGSVAVAVMRAPEPGPITVEWGPPVTVVGSIGLIAGAVWWAFDPPSRSAGPDAALDEHVA